MGENPITKKKRGYYGGGPRFGIEKPAVAGPGRPPLPPEVKVERKMLRDMADASSPRALERLSEALESTNEKNAIRAAEIILSHTLPKLEEVTNGNADPAPQLDTRIAQAILQLADAAAARPMQTQN